MFDRHSKTSVAPAVQAPLARGVNHTKHDATAVEHGVAAIAQKFYVSSFDYVKAPHQPIHPAFTQWAKDAGSAYISVVWRELNGLTLPIAVTYEVKTGTRLDWLELSGDGKKFSHEQIGDIVVEIEKHLLHSNKEILMFAEPDNKHRREVRGDLFKVKGGKSFTKDRLFGLLADSCVQATACSRLRATRVCFSSPRALPKMHIRVSGRSRMTRVFW